MRWNAGFLESGHNRQNNAPEKRAKYPVAFNKDGFACTAVTLFAAIRSIGWRTPDPRLSFNLSRENQGIKVARWKLIAGAVPSHARPDGTLGAVAANMIRSILFGPWTKFEI